MENTMAKPHHQTHEYVNTISDRYSKICLILTNMQVWGWEPTASPQRSGSFWTQTLVRKIKDRPDDRSFEIQLNETRGRDNKYGTYYKNGPEHVQNAMRNDRDYC